ncbi:hypothetical protein HJ202_15145 [Vibrio parahaemolyticus]|uniref:hypothetical protein n=1 Tax=Vibrio parahaemolyticus TaxID=670 RepID=UPI000447FA05|nr:hypothetical protein [Vibrio parahaemolyticus]EJG0941654.1 hypothetical protein [Vibrio parahaemolyticus O1]EGR2744445.1 hypothetical protein [Vibrio parahaemolyticus]EGR2873759.1 hypothetical protein [Vibrio parahaemolyticus]EHJ9988558.1 hypothetical protein [Vibrio parahaemolyticus]EJC7064428.1 hypothetical protein [Vibrio parahaemolyticus]
MTNMTQTQSIPEAIMDEMKFLKGLIDATNFKSEKLDIEIDNTAEAVSFPEYNGCAVGMVINTGKYFYKFGEDACSGVYGLMNIISTDWQSSSTGGTTVRLNSSVKWQGVAPRTFSCEYDLASEVGIPPSIYEAYAYLSANSELSKGELLEIFGGAVCSLACNTFYDDFGCTGDLESFYFDAYAAFNRDQDELGRIIKQDIVD